MRVTVMPVRPSPWSDPDAIPELFLAKTPKRHIAPPSDICALMTSVDDKSHSIQTVDYYMERYYKRHKGKKIGKAIDRDSKKFLGWVHE